MNTFDRMPAPPFITGAAPVTDGKRTLGQIAFEQFFLTRFPDVKAHRIWAHVDFFEQRAWEEAAKAVAHAQAEVIAMNLAGVKPK